MNNNGYLQFVKENRMQFLLLLISLIITVGNLYITSLVSPIKGDINVVKAQNDLQQKTLDERRPIFELVPVIEANLENIEHRLIRIETKLDK